MGRVARIAAAVFCLPALHTAAEGVPQLAQPGEPAWQPLRFRSIERTTDYAPLPGEPGGVRAEARCSASALVLPLERVDLARTPVLHWRWRVVRGLDVADERSRSGDDFAARVYVMFRFRPERAGWLERVQRALGRRLYGSEMPGTALSFVWGSRVAVGSTWTSPYTEHSRMIALASGPESGWRSESVDLPAAYERAFGESPPAAEGLGIMSDADDTCQHAVAEFRDFRLAPRTVKPDGPAPRTERP
jgi:hypothetical protein